MPTIEKVREIPGRKWNPPGHPGVWVIPFTSWHCHRVIELLGDFDLDKNIIASADVKAVQPDVEFPPGLYPFQEECVRFTIRANGRCIIADEMGLGKTIEALAFVKLFSEKIIVIAPANVIYKWEAECKTWTGEKTVAVYPSGKGELGDEDIQIMSYGIMASRYEEIKDRFYNTVIFDEAHYLKSNKSIRSRVSKAVVKSGIQYVLMLSGTPFMNRPSELFPLLNMLDPNSYANYYDFARRYCGAQYIDGFWYFPPGVVTNIEELAERLKDVMIRRTKKEVLKDLPELTRTSVPVEISNMKEYKTAVRDIKDWLKKKGKEVVNSEHVLTRLNTLRQIVGDGKVEATLELAENVLNDGKKIVIFAHHKAVVEQLKANLEASGHNVGLIDGSVAPKKRQAVIDEFLKL